MRGGLFIFGLNVLATVYRVSQRLYAKVEAEPLPVPKKVEAKHVPSGSKYFVRDEVLSGGKSFGREDFSGHADIRPQQIARSQSTNDMLQSRSPSVANLPMASAEGPAAPPHASTAIFGWAASDLVRRLPAWTEKLANALAERPSPAVGLPAFVAGSVGTPPLSVASTIVPSASPMSIVSAALPIAPVERGPTLVKPAVVTRQVLTPDETIAELGLGLHLDEYTENMRGWFSRQIVKPLQADIKEVCDHFSRVGLDHLGPSHPASFTSALFGGGGSMGIVKNSIMITPVNVSQPQTLVDLAQRQKDDPMVQKRLRIEKFLSFANLPGRRSMVLSRIEALAKGPLLAALSPVLGVDSDTEIMVALFCSFMDENLPSSDYYDAQPFSGKHLVRPGERPSQRPDAVQLCQTGPGAFELVAGSKVYRTYPGPSNLFQVLVFLVEYVHAHHEGYLGIGNLSSRAINMTSVLLAS